MSIENIHNLIKQAEIELAQLVEAQQKLQATKPMMYVFVYERFFSDEQEWGPGSQTIEGRTMEELFSVFGNFLDTFNMKTRNIRYGLWSDMQEEEEKVREYWSRESAKRRDKRQ